MKFLDRLLRIADNADAQAAQGATGLPGVLARAQGWNAQTSQWDRLLATTPSTDAFSVGTKGYLGTFAWLYNYNGLTADRVRVPIWFKHFASTAVTAGAGVVIWTPTASRKFRLMGFCVSSSAAGAVIFCDHIVGTPIARTPLLAAAGVSPAVDMKNGVLSATANNVLRADVSASGNIAGMVWGTEE